MGLKKEPTGRRATKVVAKVVATPQSAAERKAAEAELRTLIAKFAPTHVRLITSTRRWLRKRLPAAHEIVYEYRDSFVISFSPDDRGYEGVFAIRGSETGVQLYFNRGKELPDPEKLLKGSGKQTRLMNVARVAMLNRPEVETLIDEALARNQVPYASAGDGSVVIRSTSAKKRREDDRPASDVITMGQAKISNSKPKQGH